MQLLKKTSLVYFVFSLLLLLGAIPVFYFALKTMMIKSVDQNLIATKTRLMPRLRDSIVNQENGRFNFSGYDIMYKKEKTGNNSDSIYTIDIDGTIPREFLPNRQLASHFLINQELYSLQIKTSMVDKLSLVKRIVSVLSLLLVALLLGLLGINSVLTRSIWQPFYQTLKSLKEYRVEKQPMPVMGQSSIDEFNDLNHAIADLTERSHRAYAIQKEFSENASHEMQSPLAVFQSKLELLMQTKPLNEEQAALITDLADASKRLSRLNKSLVLLTRIDNNQFLEKENVSIKDSLEKIMAQYAFQASQQSIHIEMEGIHDIRLDANRTLIEILLGNLLSNAIRHNIKGGHVKIMLEEKSLVIQNTGKAGPLDADKIFLRFQKESNDPGSIGIGLEIVKKICDLNHYAIQYSFSDGLHRFTLSF